MAIEPLWSKICIKKQRENAALGLFECSLCLCERLSTGIYHLYNKYSFINEFTLALHRQQHRTTYTNVKLNLKTQFGSSFFCWERERQENSGKYLKYNVQSSGISRIYFCRYFALNVFMHYFMMKNGRFLVNKQSFIRKLLYILANEMKLPA